MLSLFRFHGWHCLRFSQPRIAGRYFCIVFVVLHILRRWYLSGSQMFCNTFIVWPRELALKWIDAPREDPAPECGHVIERKDSAHDRSEQFCAMGCSDSCVACFQWELHYCTCRSRFAGPACCDVVIFASAAQRYVCWKRLMPGTAFIGRWTLSLVRRDLWSYCYFWNWQTSWWRRLFCIDITACYFVLFCQVPTSSRRCCRFWTDCSKQWSQQETATNHNDYVIRMLRDREREKYIYIYNTHRNSKFACWFVTLEELKKSISAPGALGSVLVILAV